MMTYHVFYLNTVIHSQNHTATVKINFILTNNILTENRKIVVANRINNCVSSVYIYEVKKINSEHKT